MDTLPTLAEIAAPDDPLAFAEQMIRAVADELTERLRAKGYPKATVEFWIGRFEGRIAFINDNIGRRVPIPFEVTTGASVRAIAEKLRAAIDALPDPMADAWQFDPNDPRNKVEAAP